MLRCLLHTHRGLFYSPKAARSRWRQSWKAIPAFCRVEHRTVRCATGQSDAPPDSHCSLSGARFPSKSGTVDRCSSGPVGTPDTVRCIPDSPVPPADRWSCHASPEDFAADRWRWRPLAHRTVWCTTGQSGEL
jgi:hypothetical protein